MYSQIALMPLKGKPHSALAQSMVNTLVHEDLGEIPNLQSQRGMINLYNETNRNKIVPFL
jgi:hypothetical protein